MTHDAAGLTPVAVEGLRTDDDWRVLRACDLLCELGPDAVGAAPAVIDSLRGRTRWAKCAPCEEAALSALYSLGPEFADVEHAIRAKLGSDDAYSRILALQALETVHGAPASLADLVISHLEAEPSDDVCFWGLVLLGRLAPRDVRTQRLLLGRTVPPDDSLVRAFGPAAAGLVPRLLAEQRRSDESSEPRWRLASFGEIATPEAVAGLAGYLGVGRHRRDALLALAQTGAKAAPALDRVVMCLAVEPEAAAAALSAMGPATAPALPRMRRWLGRVPKAAVPDLADAIRKAGGNFECVWPVLAPLLQGADDPLRVQAARALGRWGAEARPALPALEALLDRGGVLERSGLEVARAIHAISGDGEALHEWSLHLLRHHALFEVEGIRARGVLGPRAADAVDELVAAALAWRRAGWKEPEQTRAALETLGRIGAPAGSALPVIRSLGRNRLFEKEAAEAEARIEAALRDEERR
jgi:hypothetical protein